MQVEVRDTEEVVIGKKLYDYQVSALQEIFERLKVIPPNYNILFQLPTGGGKTVIFSEIARRYIEQNQKRVLILTHRIELARQTSSMLDEFKVRNKATPLSSNIKLPMHDNYNELIQGATISDLIKAGFLAQATT